MTAIVQAEVLTKYSISAAAGNTTTSAASTSLGKQISTTAWLGGVVNDLFPNVTGAQNAASQVDYSCIFVHNNNATNALASAYVFLSAETAGGASISVAVDNLAASAIAAAVAQSATIANSITAPVGVGAFVSPTTLGTALALGSIPVGFCRAVWIKRTAANTVALSGDGVTLTIGGDTGSL